MALFLSDLTLVNLRSHGRARISAGPRPVALFGPNGAGKTNVLEAVSLLSPGRGMRRSSAADITRRGAPGWTIRAVLQGPDRPRDILVRSEDGAARSLRVDDKPEPQATLGRIARVLWLVPAMDRLWIEGAEGRRRFLDRMTLSFFPGHGEAVLTYEKSMRDRNRLLKDQNRDAGWYDALEQQMATSGVQVMAQRQAALDRIAQAQAGAATAFPAAGLALTHPDGDLPDTAEALRTAWAQARAGDMHAGRTRIGPHRVDMLGTYEARQSPAADCSTGEQKALLISLILANARALVEDIGAPPILLLDEVAAHLDPDRRAALYDEICALGAQAWMTGTEQALFDALGYRADYLEVTHDGDASQVHSVSD